jgi:cysteinyl-tRNA synthetase
MLGLLQDNAEAFLKGAATAQGLSDPEIEALIAQRNAARAGKDWAEADRIRDQLQENGVVLEDSAGVTRWRRG